MIYKILGKTEKYWQDKKFVEATLKDPEGNDFKVSAWRGEYDGKEEIDCELEKNDKGYWVFKKQKIEKPNFIKAKEAQMSQAMETKAKNIAQAQDRSAWMWAKNNASMLIANQKQDAVGIRDLKEISDMVIDLATKIYNGEPMEPFN